MNITSLVQAMTDFELSSLSIQGRSIAGCHFEINPDGGGCLQIRPMSAVEELLANSPICSIKLEFANEAELAQLCDCMTADPRAVCKRAERQLQSEIERLAEEATR